MYTKESNLSVIVFPDGWKMKKQQKRHKQSLTADQNLTLDSKQVKQ